MTQSTPLSAREQEVAELLLQGRSNKQIAAGLGISIRTVEFHLKNIYAKFHVSSRIELILKLGNTTGSSLNKKLGYSTVDRPGEKAENRDRLISQVRWSVARRSTFSILGKELDMKYLQDLRHTLVGIPTALLTGFSWMAVLIYYGNLSVDEVKAVSIPLIIILTITGISVGWIAKRIDSTLGRVFLSTLLGTSLGLFTVLPVMMAVVIPLGKVAAQLDLIDPSTISYDYGRTLGAIAMLTTWLITGIMIGVALLFVTFKKPGKVENHKPVTENGW